MHAPSHSSLEDLVAAFVKLRREGILAEVNPDFSTDLDLADGGDGVFFLQAPHCAPASFYTRVAP